MLALAHMSYGAQALFYGIALVAFVISAVLGYMTKAMWALFVALGLVCWTFIAFWNALALA